MWGGYNVANAAEAPVVTIDTNTVITSADQLPRINGGTEPDYSYNIKVENGSSLTIQGVNMYGPKIESNGDVVLDFTGKTGIVLAAHDPGTYSQSSLAAKNLSVIAKDAAWTNGLEIYAGYGKGKIDVDVEKNLYIEAGKNGIILSGEVGDNSNVTVNAGAIDVKAGSAAFIIQIGKNNNMIIDAKDYIKTNGYSGVSNNGDNGLLSVHAGNDIDITARGYWAVSAISGNGNNLKIISDNGDINLSALTEHEYGKNAVIQASSKDNVKIEALKGNITVTGTNGIVGRNDDVGEAKISLDAINNYITASNKAIDARKQSVIKVTSQNDTKVIGDVLASTGGSATVDYHTKDSFLYGRVLTSYADENGDKSLTDLDFTNGSTWYMTGDSNVTDLTFKNSVIDMTERKDGKNARVLTVDKAMTGDGGVFKMDLKYLGNEVGVYESGKESDFIKVFGTNDGEYTIEFENNDDNLGAMHKGDKLYFAEVNEKGTMSFGQGATVTQANESGLYDYEFKVKSDNKNNDNLNDWFITLDNGAVNPNGETPVKSYNAAFALWRDDDTLLKRLGEVRFSDDEGGVWARAIGKKLEDDRSMGFNTHAKTIQVGYDRKDVQKDGSGTWRKGIAIGHTWADTSFGSGDGTNNYTDLSLYATNIRKHDHYWDFVVRVGRIDSEYDTVYGDHGEFDNWASSVSAEYGRKKKLNEDNWFIEPQAQLTYSYVWGDSYTTNKGIRVEQDNADSLVGRAGFIISKELESERKYPHRYYAKAFVMHEFLDGGDNNLYLGSDRFYSGADFKDTWYVVGIGANVDMGNNCDFYLDAEKNFKASVEMPYRIEAGFRWEF